MGGTRGQHPHRTPPRYYYYPPPIPKLTELALGLGQGPRPPGPLEGNGDSQGGVLRVLGVPPLWGGHGGGMGVLHVHGGHSRAGQRAGGGAHPTAIALPGEGGSVGLRHPWHCPHPSTPVPIPISKSLSPSLYPCPHPSPCYPHPCPHPHPYSHIPVPTPVFPFPSPYPCPHPCILLSPYPHSLPLSRPHVLVPLSL